MSNDKFLKKNIIKKYKDLSNKIPKEKINNYLKPKKPTKDVFYKDTVTTKVEIAKVIILFSKKADATETKEEIAETIKNGITFTLDYLELKIKEDMNLLDDEEGYLIMLVIPYTDVPTLMGNIQLTLNENEHLLVLEAIDYANGTAIKIAH